MLKHLKGSYKSIEDIHPNSTPAEDKTELVQLDAELHAFKIYTATVKMLNMMILGWENKAPAQKAASLREYRWASPSTTHICY